MMSIIEAYGDTNFNFKLHPEEILELVSKKWTQKESIKYYIRENLNTVIELVDEYISLEVDFLEKRLCKITFLNGYHGRWKEFQPGLFQLSDILEFDNSFEHMTRGLITSENYKGVGFEISQIYEDEYHFLELGLEVKSIIEKININIPSITVFPEFIGNKNIWDFYDAYIWDEKISNSRF